MLVKDMAKTPDEIIPQAQIAASKMSVSLLQTADNIEQNWDRAMAASAIRSIAKQLQEDMTEWIIS